MTLQSLSGAGDLEDSWSATSLYLNPEEVEFNTGHSSRVDGLASKGESKQAKSKLPFSMSFEGCYHKAFSK